MKRTAFTNSQDERVAEESTVDHRLMCSAKGCPNRWSTSDGYLCRWHADALPHRWPEVTQGMHDHITDRAYAAGLEKPRAPVLSVEDKAAILRRAAAVFSQPKPNPRAWIDVLRAKQRAGIALSPMQKHCLAQVRQTGDV